MTGEVEGPWTCFHCDETFTTREAAAAHFGDGNYEREEPVCIEAATTELKALVSTNREMWGRLQAVERDLEQVEYERDCWASAGSTACGKPSATWHDLAMTRDEMEGRVLAAEAVVYAAPPWLRALLRWRVEWRWRRDRARMRKLTRKAEALAGRA